MEGFAEFLSGDESVELARALGLAFHFDTAGCVLEINTAGCFIDFLATAAGSTDEFLDKVRGENAELDHAGF